VKYEITREPLDPQSLLDAVRSDECGAIVTFLGVVRVMGDGDRPVDGLAYEAYPEMALPEMRAIGAEASSRFGEARVAIAHRIGDLALGEVSVAIAVASKHRAVAFDACEYVIDELKQRVPIWKRENYRDGETRWRPNASPHA
jgi:molybdopterin synthase catalytic subunit